VIDRDADTSTSPYAPFFEALALVSTWSVKQAAGQLMQRP
jgi:hypothetical protein